MAEAKPSRGSRAAYTIVYVFVMGYGALMILGSLVWDLYGTPSAENMANPMWCKGQLAELHAELENQAQQELQAMNPGERKSERWRRWQGNWSERFQRASKACIGSDPTVTDGYATLNELSTSYGGVLQELSGARMHLRNHLDETVRRMTK